MAMIYQRKGGPLLQWGRAASPAAKVGQGRAADALSLGDYVEETGGARVVSKRDHGPIYDGSLSNYEPVPKAGGPEIIGDSETSASNLVTLAAVGGAVWYLFFKKNSRYRVTKRAK